MNLMLVLLHGLRVGTLSEESDGAVTFAYDADWILAGGAPVAGLPIVAEPYDLLSVQPFVDTSEGLSVVPARRDAAGRVVMALRLDEGRP